MPDYASMQAQITQAYRAIGEELHAPVAPVGDAWAIVAAERPEIPLWQNDGSHPTEQGTFLAANVLVATVFHEVPLGLGTRGRVPEVQVNALQQAAVRATLGAAPR
jgi:lysophospholipase L1-like esterase